MSLSADRKEELFEEAVGFFQTLQSEIIVGLERTEQQANVFPTPGQSFEPGSFRRDKWTREAGSSILSGGGLSCVLAQGRVFERAGVNFSDVSGSFSTEMAAALPGKSAEFRASGVSLVLHPRSPQVPTVHANFRVIRRGTAGEPERIWFGGGADLTPYRLYAEDAVHFHSVWRTVCQRHSAVADYQKLKAQCDEYFFLPHRGEARGIGGIFFDYFTENLPACFDFVRDAGTNFLNAYLPIVERRTALPYNEQEKEFQLLRRGRYVEFNLVYDRGTQFGLKTGGRTESILMSMPPVVHWQYDFAPRNEQESELIEVLRSPRQWV